MRGPSARAHAGWVSPRCRRARGRSERGGVQRAPILDERPGPRCGDPGQRSHRSVLVVRSPGG